MLLKRTIRRGLRRLVQLYADAAAPKPHTAIPLWSPARPIPRTRNGEGPTDALTRTTRARATMAELAWMVLGKHPQLGLTATTIHDVTSSSQTADAVMPPAGPDTTTPAAPAAPSASAHRTR